jgi:hypothetical protein
MVAMANTAFQQLHEQLEEVRREAYAEGYAHALQELTEFLARKANARPNKNPNPPIEILDGPAPANGKMKPRGENRRIVEGAFRELGPRSWTPTEIVNHLEQRKVKIAYSSVRHAIDQLEQRHILRKVSDEANTWKLIAQDAGAQPLRSVS